MRIAELLSQLPGCWHFHRTITPNQGTVTGLARFTSMEPHGNSLLYREDGILALSHDKFIVYREYIYHFLNNQISVLFKDGSLFQTLEFLEPTKAMGTHPCVRDVYESVYQFTDTDSFQIVHRVNGPLKNYVSSTFFERIHPLV